MQPVAPVSVSLQASRALMRGLVLAHSLAALAVLVASIPGWLIALLMLFVGASFARWRQIPAPMSLLLRGDGFFEKVGSGGTALEVDGSSTMLAWLVVLRFREAGRMRSLILLPDSFMRPDDARRFRRWFIWQAARNA